MFNIKFIETTTFKKLFIFFSVLVSAISINSNAMSLYFEKPETDIKVGDTTILNVYLDSGDSEVNGIEGVIKVTGPVSISNLNVAGSVFSLWPNKPSLSGDEISFVGGSTSGFFGKKNKVFSIIFKAGDIGNVNISLKQADVFLNDGKGTKIVALGVKQNFEILKSDNQNTNQLSDLILNDKIPPESFKIDLGQDLSINDGKYFISFYSTDNESGINRYEVRENNLPSVRTGNSYVLGDQTLKGNVEVRAIDNAGNIRTETINLNKYNSKNSLFYIVILAIITLLTVLTLVYFKNKSKKNKK